MTAVMDRTINQSIKAQVHCPICTHAVPAEVAVVGKRTRVVPGQKCPRCKSSLDVAMILEVLRAA